MKSTIDAPAETTPGRPQTDNGAAGPQLHPARELQCSKEVRILILDDDPATCQVIEAALGGKEFVIHSISEPAVIEDKLRAAGPDGYHLVILDYVLPGTEPGQIFNMIHGYLPDASVVVITGYPSIDSALNSLRARAYDYLTKPFQVAQLRQVVNRCLETKGLLRMTEEALRESLGTAIRERRKALGLTLAQMAARTDVSLGYLSQIELGKNSASIETLYRICLSLGIRMADLFQAVQAGGSAS